MIDFDHVMAEMGGMGKYQVCLIFMFLYWSIPSGYNAVAPVFINYTPDYRCKVDNIANFTAGMNESEILNLTAPINPDGQYDRCKRYQYRNNNTCTDICDFIDHESDVIPCNEGYHYDTSLFTKTAVSEFDLVCDQAYLDSLATSLYMVGQLCGSLILGYISDRWGRKNALGISAIAILAALIGCALVQTYWLFLIFRFLIAVFDAGIFFTAFVYAQEVASDKWRTLVGVSFQIGYAIGYMLLSGIAYYWHNWHEIQFAMSVIFMPTVLFLFIIPESPRWLFANGYDEKAKQISRLMAKRKGVQIDEKSIWRQKKKLETGSVEQPLAIDREDEVYSTIDLFRTPRIRVTTFLAMFNWFANGFVYYGVTLSVGSLSGDIFINNAFGALGEIVGSILVAIFMDRTGRRPLIIFMLCLAGIGLISSTVVTELAGSNESLTILGVVFAQLAKLGISASFAAIHNYTSEVFPTVVRSNAMSIGSICSVVGGAVAPFMLTLLQISWLPNVLFGVIASIAAVLTIYLPETKDQHLLESIEAAEAFYAKNEFSIRRRREYHSATAF